jgi:hypothetical protein
MLDDKLKLAIEGKRQGQLRKGVGCVMHDSAHPHTVAHTIKIF